MRPEPSKVSGSTILCYTSIDGRHRHTGNCHLIVDGVLQGPAAGLIICQFDGESGFYLFGCDENWDQVTDTWHQTLEDAQHQAEFEYEGVSKTWVYPTYDGAPAAD